MKNLKPSGIGPRRWIALLAACVGFWLSSASPPLAQTIVNPSFEVDPVPPWPGHGPITGWASGWTGGSGINPVDSNGPFADNGRIPDGSKVAYMQANTYLSQMVHGFTTGATYRLVYYENARNCCGGIASNSVLVSGVTLVAPHRVNPVGGSNSYVQVVTDPFTATAADLEIAFIKTGVGDSTVLIDNVILLLPNGPPFILRQPQDQVALVNGAATFNVTALTNGPLSYQWRFNGAELSGATNSSLVLSNVTMLNDGFYTVRVSNAYDSVLSSPARLMVNTPGNMAFYSNDFEGPVGSEWSNTKTEVTPMGRRRFLGQIGNDTVSLSLSNLPPHTNFTVSFDLFLIRSWDYVLSAGTNIWDLSVSGGPRLVHATFSMWVNQSFPDAYSLGDHPALTGAAELNTLGFVIWGTVVDAVYRLTYSLPHTNTSLDLNFAGMGLEAMDNESWGLDNVAVTLAADSATPWSRITAQPQSQGVPLGSNVTFTVTATGPGAFSYQWKKDGVSLLDDGRISGAATPTLTISNIQASDLGGYTVVVRNAYGSAVSSLARLTLSPPAFQWARQGGGTGEDFTEGLALDQAGGVYLAGRFRGTATLGSNAVTSRGGSDIFLARYDTNGVWKWVRTAGGTGDDWARLIAVDNEGNCYVTGEYQFASTFGSVTITSAGATDLFLAKYRADGTLLWVRTAGGPGADRSTSVATDEAGDCYVTGFFNGNAVFGSVSLTSFGEADMFVAKYDAVGNLRWVRKAGGSAGDGGADIGVDDAANCYVTGWFSAPATFESSTLQGYGGIDFFLAKYDTNGNLIWVRSSGGTDLDLGYGIAVDGPGNCFVTGTFNRHATFGPTILVSSGLADTFLAKYDSAGNLGWIRQAGGTGDDWGSNVALDSFGNSYFVGTFSSVAGFDGATLTNAGNRDIFVARYDPAGKLIWAQRAGGAGQEDSVNCAVDAGGDCYLCGRFDGTARFSPFALTSRGSSDAFLAKLPALYVPTSIAVQPQSQTVLVGGNAEFSVVATGTEPLSYQWRENGTDIAEATVAGLVLTNVQPSQSGSVYSVVVSNPVASTTSSNAYLTVLLLPPPWTGHDVGSVGVPGSAIYSNATFFVRGSGEDVEGTSDAFHFVHQTFAGDGQILARLVSLQNTDPRAEAGVMMRESLGIGSKHALMAMSYSKIAKFRRRLETNQYSSENTSRGLLPCWLRLMRMGNTFIGHQSTNGVDWNLVWYTTLDMPSQAEAGLAVTAHNYGALNTAVFDNVSMGVLTPLTGTWPLPGPKIYCGGEPFNMEEMLRIGGFKVLVGGNVGDRYEMESSTDLRGWSGPNLLTNTYGVVPYLDPGATNLQYRFYRTVLP